MKRRDSKILEAAPGVQIPKGWRSSFLRRDMPVLAPNLPPEYALCLGRHVIPTQTVSIVRRIEAEPFDPPVEKSLVTGVTKAWKLGTVPDWWHMPGLQPGVPEWDWQWNIGHVGNVGPWIDRLPGSLIQSPVLGRIKDLLGEVQFDYCDDWQRLASWPNGPIHHTPARYFVQGPQVIFLFAIVFANPDGGPSPMPRVPFGMSFGSIEGIDVPAREFLASPHRWLTL